MKKTLKHSLACLIALAMLVVMAIPAFAANDGRITISNVQAGNVYKLYKVFDATVSDDNSAIAYKLVDGKNAAPEGFTVDNKRNVTLPGEATELTEAQITAIKGYVTNADLVDTKTAAENATTVVFDNLAYGYYYITTTTGTAVTIDSTKKAADVQDKNNAPGLKKEAVDNELTYEIGDSIPYKVTITVGAGAENYTLTDTLSNGLTLNQDSLEVNVLATRDDPETTDVDETAYNQVSAGNYTATKEAQKLTIAFTDAYVGGLADGTEIVITYSATLNDNAVTGAAGNENSVSLTYGHDPEDSSKPKNTTPTTDDTKVKAYTAEIDVKKTDNANANLAGATFALKNAEGKYYKYANAEVTWVENLADATTVTSDAEGTTMVFKGLAEGTYTLTETVTPDGYNTAADETITIAAGAYTDANLKQAKTIINNKGSILPSTGGIGTYIVVIAGLAIVAAGVILMTKRNKKEEE